MKILVLKGRDLEELLKPEVLIPEIEKAFVAYSEGKTVTPPRTVMYVENHWWGIMQSYVPGYGVGVKIVNIYPENIQRGLPTIQAIVALLDAETGSPLAVMDGTVLTGLRTAAACAISVKYMAPEEKGPIAIIGTGFQARYFIRFVKSVYPVEEVKIFDIRRDVMESYAKYVESLGLKVVKCESVSQAVKGSRVVFEATTAEQPVILGKDLEPPVHVVSIGVRGKDYRTIDEETFRLAERVVVDSKTAVMEEVADLRIPVEKGLIKLEDVAELGEVIAKKKPGRVGRGITLFKSVGLAIQDAVAASVAYRLAKEKGIGVEIEI